jgi:arylsulfatase A-like enzyme
MNVLCIMVDQWPGGLMGCAGHPDILTPTLDELAPNGVRFGNCYSATPVCIPARREIMTGVDARIHGDKCFNESQPMPELPTLADCFSRAGYQTYAVGKLHVYPQRDRIGFDDVLLYEEGRHKNGLRQDDYERFLAREGYAGLEYMHGMCNNNYLYRPWHLREAMHPTSWITREMCETIKRKDPTKPALWFLSYNHPHPPLAPLAEYLDLYDDVKPEKPYFGEWTEDAVLPSAYSRYRERMDGLMTTDRAVLGARRAFYALCTHIDHQLRTVIGTLREEGLLDNTAIVFTSDHGDMLGNHGLWGKNLFYEDSCKIPLLLIPPLDCREFEIGTTDDRLTELRDIMPTLLDMAGIDIPAHVNGISLTARAGKAKEQVYGELWKDRRATRMIRWSDYKLIYCPVTNARQVFDIAKDPLELRDVHAEPAYADVTRELEERLMAALYDEELNWVVNGNLIGGVSGKKKAGSGSDSNVLKRRELLLQRGLR